jgi:hypothetical protein
MTRHHLSAPGRAGAASALALTTALIAAPGPGRCRRGHGELADGAAGDAVSLTVTLRLEGLEPQEVEIEDASYYAVAEPTLPQETVFPWHNHPGTRRAQWRRARAR